MPVVMLKGRGSRKFKKHLKEEHPELKHVVILKEKPVRSKRRKF